jgi:hypothetical protein
MEEAVFRKNTEIVSDYNFIRDMIIDDTSDNFDINVSLDGYVHNGEGFIISINNIESINDSTLNKWVEAIENRYMSCTVDSNFTDGVIRLTCIFLPKKSRCGMAQLYTLMYLSASIYSLKEIWTYQ